jgi:hypothetical protein
LLTRWFEHEIEPLFERHRALAEKSLERKIAHVRESVIAVLQTIASRRGEAGQPGGNKADVQRAGQLLNQADTAILRTRERCRDWPSDAPALVEIVLRDAAQRLLKPPTGSERPGNDVVVRVIQEMLLQRAQMARQVIGELQQTLRRTLEAIQGITGLTNTDISPVRDFISSELPIPVLSGSREKLHTAAPWWRAILPRWAVPVLRRWLEKHVGPAIREFVKAYNDQLEVWMKERGARLADLYQSQAEVLREQVRRTTARGASIGSAADAEDLMRDLGELQSRGESEEVPAVSSPAP